MKLDLISLAHRQPFEAAEKYFQRFLDQGFRSETNLSYPPYACRETCLEPVERSDRRESKGWNRIKFAEALA